MKTKSLFAALLLLGVITTFSSCKKDDEAPEITIENPADGTVLSPGDALEIDLEFTDNEELKEAKVDIHEAGGHSHGKFSSEFDYEEIIELSGSSSHKHVHVNIPTDAELGEYHIEVTCTDKEGNQASKVGEFDIQ